MIGARGGSAPWFLTTTAALAVVLSSCAAPTPDPIPPTDSSPTAPPSAGSGEVPAPASPGPEAQEGAADYADPASVSVVVNKRRPINPADFAPADLVLPAVPLAVDQANATLRPDAATAVEEMFAAAAVDGVGLTLVSGYRSYAVQADTYNYWVSISGGTDNADDYSARPGFSEHQTGLAFDIGQADGACTLTGCFNQTAAARWAADNAHRFGFILRYPEGRQETTGFLAESWHYRFVGVSTSTAMMERGTETLEEHFGLPDAPDYG